MGIKGLNQWESMGINNFGYNFLQDKIFSYVIKMRRPGLLRHLAPSFPAAGDLGGAYSMHCSRVLLSCSYATHMIFATYRILLSAYYSEIAASRNDLMPIDCPLVFRQYSSVVIWVSSEIILPETAYYINIVPYIIYYIVIYITK